MKALFALVVWAACPVIALAAQVNDTSYAAPDGTRVLRHEVVLPASPAEVYAAFASAEGWRTWAVPFAEITPAFGVGAVLETSYDPAARISDATNIKNKVLAYIPDRMFAFQALQAPTGFRHADLLPHIFTVAEFETAGPDATRVRLSMLGYGQGAAFDELYAFFARGNAWTMEKLAERFERGPIDWSKTKPAAKN